MPIAFRPLAGSAGLIVLFFTGCATPGPNHLYSLAGGGRPVVDFATAEGASATVPSLTKADETVCGVAYESNLDHVFVRVAPGNIIREIERPSGRLFREIHVPGVPPFELPPPATDGLAVRSSNRHLFLNLPGDQSIAEVTIYSKLVRTFPLHTPRGAIGGLAYDQKGDRLLVLYARPAGIATVTIQGDEESFVPLAEFVRPVGLGYDSDLREFYVPLADGANVGVFDRDGHMLRRYLLPDGSTPGALDAGPRSFFRLF